MKKQEGEEGIRKKRGNKREGAGKSCVQGLRGNRLRKGKGGEEV